VRAHAGPRGAGRPGGRRRMSTPLPLSSSRFILVGLAQSRREGPPAADRNSSGYGPTNDGRCSRGPNPARSGYTWCRVSALSTTGRRKHTATRVPGRRPGRSPDGRSMRRSDRRPPRSARSTPGGRPGRQPAARAARRFPGTVQTAPGGRRPAAGRPRSPTRAPRQFAERPARVGTASAASTVRALRCA